MTAIHIYQMMTVLWVFRSYDSYIIKALHKNKAFEHNFDERELPVLRNNLKNAVTEKKTKYSNSQTGNFPLKTIDNNSLISSYGIEYVPTESFSSRTEDVDRDNVLLSYTNWKEIAHTSLKNGFMLPKQGNMKYLPEDEYNPVKTINYIKFVRNEREDNAHAPQINLKDADTLTYAANDIPIQLRNHQLSIEERDVRNQNNFIFEKERRMLMEQITPLEDKLSAEGDEFDDTAIYFGSDCDHKARDTCWFVRQIGAAITLSINISSSRKPTSFVIRWIRIYKKYKVKKAVLLELQPGMLPWNMVWGSGGLELRLNPVTDTDINPNAIQVKIFSVKKKHGKELYKQLKALNFHIEIPFIDMGKIYVGEELNINLENYISLPEAGNMLFEWTYEKPDHTVESLPSNVKISPSGRSIVVKELKKSQRGVLNCVVYSSTQLAVARRRFSMSRIGNVLERRSPHLNGNKKHSPFERLRSSFRRCTHKIKNNPAIELKKLMEFERPISRRKRLLSSVKLGRMLPSPINVIKRDLYRDCHPWPFQKRIYRSLPGFPGTTQDSRIMPIEKLIQLSEESDGTLDDVIPHEIHYVRPAYSLVTDTLEAVLERSVDELSYLPNCTTNADCAKEAVCVIPKGQKGNLKGHTGYCYCKPEYFGDGFVCYKIPIGNHRDKRIRRQVSKIYRDFKIEPDLFYSDKTTTPNPTATESNDQVDSEVPTSAKVLAFEEEDSFVLSNCSDSKDCSSHASCIQPSNGHAYCKCNPGFRGNGIFCWEIIDYVPIEEQIAPEEKIPSAAK